MAEKASTKRLRDDAGEPEVESPEVKRMKYDLLDLLDDSDPNSPTPDLDFVIKSFAEEISTAPSESPAAPPVRPAEYSGESQPELGYLLEASDDELGLPPPSSEVRSEEPDSFRDSFDSAGIGEFWGFGDEIPKFDSFDFGLGEGNAFGGGGDYVALGGLFDYSDALPAL